MWLFEQSLGTYRLHKGVHMNIGFLIVSILIESGRKCEHHLWLHNYWCRSTVESAADWISAALYEWSIFNWKPLLILSHLVTSSPERQRTLKFNSACDTSQPHGNQHGSQTRYSLFEAAGGLEQGPVYTKRQRQCCDNSAMTLAILFSLKSVESLENRLQPHSGATPLFSMRMEWQASLQSCRSVDLTLGINGPLYYVLVIGTVPQIYCKMNSMPSEFFGGPLYDNHLYNIAL